MTCRQDFEAKPVNALVTGHHVDSDVNGADLPWAIPTIRELWKDRKLLFDEKEREEAWARTATIVKTYSDETVQRWNAEIDTLLVYAGLFSGILTAFNVQSYQLLQPAPPDPLFDALQQISARLSSFSVNPPFVNSTRPLYVYREPSSPPPPLHAVYLNTLWFSSLICSLSAASMGIMVKQWLNEYKSGLSGTSREIARLRQYRLDNLQKWHVAEIVAILPVLLQLALLLFFSGLLVLLWNLHRTVAVFSSVLIGLLALFTICTIILPSIRSDCSYLSPLSSGFFLLTQNARRALHRLHRPLDELVRKIAWSHRNAHTRVRQAMRHIERLVNLFFCHPRSALTWRGREHHIIRIRRENIDTSMVMTAYSTTMSTDYLADASVCFTDLRAASIVECFQRIYAINRRHWGPNHAPLLLRLQGNVWSDVLLSLLTIDPGRRGPEWDAVVGNVDQYLYFAATSDDVARSNALLTTLARAALHQDELGHDDLAFRMLAQLLMWADVHEVRLGSALRYVAVAAQERMRTHAKCTQQAEFRRYFDALRILLQCAARSTPADVSAEDHSLICAAARRGLLETADLLRSPSWNTAVRPEMLHDVLDLLCSGPEAGRALVPQGLVEVLETHVVDLLKAEAEASGETFWAARYEEAVGRLHYIASL